MDVRVSVLLTASLASVSGDAPWYSAGYSRAPTPTMAPCPCMRRGTEWTVPMVPGLVRLIVVPTKSSTPSLPALALRMRSSYADQKPVKSIVSAALMAGTSSCRVPSGLARSMASPRLIRSGRAITGLPSSSA